MYENEGGSREDWEVTERAAWAEPGQLLSVNTGENIPALPRPRMTPDLDVSTATQNPQTAKFNHSH